MQISLVLNLDDGHDGSPVDAAVDTVATAYDGGFHRVWMPQMPWEPDLLTVLAVAFREVPDVEIGTAVLPIQLQHPVLMAQRALTVNVVADGRLLLGIGLNHRSIVEDQWGIRWYKPVQRLHEYLDGLLPLLSDQTADATGDQVTTRTTVTIPGAPAPPVYVAALGPHMLDLAGRRSAGTITWMTGPNTVARHIAPRLREAEHRAGRVRGAARVVTAVPVCVTDEPDRTRALAADQFAIYGELPSYRSTLDREGYRGPEEAALIGDEATVRERINSFKASGVDEFAAYVFGSGEQRARTRTLLRALQSEQAPSDAAASRSADV